MRSMVVLDSWMEIPQNQKGENEGRVGKDDQVDKKREIRQTLSKRVKERTQQINPRSSQPFPGVWQNRNLIVSIG